MRYLYVIFLITTYFSLNLNANLNILPPIENYRFVTGDFVNVRLKPTLNSTILASLRIGSKLKILKQNETLVTIGKMKGYWVYVDFGKNKTDSSLPSKGWIYSYFLANTDKFIKINKFNKFKFRFSLADISLTIDFLKNGKYKRKWINNFDKNKVYSEGRLYRYKNVVLLIRNNSEQKLFMHETFYFDKKNKFCTIIFKKSICSLRVLD